MLAAFKFCSPFFLNHSIALLFFSLVSCTYVINCCLHILLFSFSFYHLMPMNLFFLFFILICRYFILSMFVKCSFFLYLKSTSVCLNYSFNLFFSISYGIIPFVLVEFCIPYLYLFSIVASYDHTKICTKLTMSMIFP